jgi:hypothetical protein
MTVRLSALRAGCPLPSGKFLVLISLRDLVDPRVIVRLKGSGQFQKSNNVIWNRTRHLSACSIVPQPTTLHVLPVTGSHFILSRLHLHFINFDLSSDKFTYFAHLMRFPNIKQHSVCTNAAWPINRTSLT